MTTQLTLKERGDLAFLCEDLYTLTILWRESLESEQAARCHDWIARVVEDKVKDLYTLVIREEEQQK